MKFDIWLIWPMLAVAYVAVFFLRHKVLELKRKEFGPTYTQKLDHLLPRLRETSIELDRMRYALDIEIRRQSELSDQLDKTIAEQNQRVEQLSSVNPDAAKHFLALLEPTERRAALRDYGLFIAGLVIGYWLK